VFEEWDEVGGYGEALTGRGVDVVDLGAMDPEVSWFAGFGFGTADD
jgi:hypothetical protein